MHLNALSVSDALFQPAAAQLFKVRDCPTQQADFSLKTSSNSDGFSEIPKTPVVIMTGNGDQEAAVEAMKAGALDYIVKSKSTLLDLPMIAERVLREWSHIQKRERAEQALRQSLARTELLYSTASVLMTPGDLPKKLHHIIENVAESLPASIVSITLLNLAQRRITQQVIGGLQLSTDTTYEGFATFSELWESLSGWVLRNLESALSFKNQPDSRESHEAQQRRQKLNLGSMMAVPITYQGRTLGVLSAMNRLDERDFTQRGLNLMNALANQLAGAIENVRLSDEMRELLNAVQQQADETQEILDAVPCGVFLLDLDCRLVKANLTAQFQLKMWGEIEMGDLIDQTGFPLPVLMPFSVENKPQEFVVTSPSGKSLEVTVYSTASHWLLVMKPSNSKPPETEIPLIRKFLNFYQLRTN